MSTICEYADKLLAHFDALGLQPATGVRGWSHMGGLISDAALQSRTNYKKVVLPRVVGLVEAWPDAETVSGFAARLAADDLGAVLRWRGQAKLTRILDLTMALQALHIETASNLADAYLTAPEQTRTCLRRIHGVGPKTVDYIAILAGSVNHVAVDSRLRQFATHAGLPALSYGDLSTVIKCAAKKRGWDPGALDAAIWRHMTGQP